MKTANHILIAFTGAVLLLSNNIFNIQDNQTIISTEEELVQDMKMLTCNDKERGSAVRNLLTKHGVKEDEISVDYPGKVENIVFKRTGKNAEFIVVGAHYDKTSEGCGAIDNWTGIVVIANLYKTLKDIPLEKNIIFVAFGKEEKGLLGSKAMVKSLKKEELNQYCAMVNIDSLGMAPPQVAENLSSKFLVNLATEIAVKMEMPFNKVNIPGALADSVPFVDKKIPALTISAVSNGWANVLHSKNDQLDKVNSASLYLGYRLALAVIARLDKMPCNASREPKG